MRPFVKILSVLFLLTVLSGCYLPARFDAEITLDRAGYYTMKFDGYLAYIPLYQKLKDRKISPAEEKERVQIVSNDFTRDTAVKEIQYYKMGHFRVKWEKSGDLLRTKMVSFFRRNANMLSLSYVRSKREISLLGAYIRKDQRTQLEDMGLNIQGQLRLITEARVISHNATKVGKRDGKPMYTWDIQNVRSPTPRMTIVPG